MTVALIDDQQLGHVLQGRVPRVLRNKDLYTTGYWYVRLCQAVLGSDERQGKLSRPFNELPETLRSRAMSALIDLPTEIGLVSLRDLAPTIARLRPHHQLNILGIEALAAAIVLDARVFLSASSPGLEGAFAAEDIRYRHL